MKSSAIPAESGYLESVHPSGGVESLGLEESQEFIQQHPLGVKPLGNQYTASVDARRFIGPFQILPDEILAILLEGFESRLLQTLGSTCKFLYAFCRSEDLWKTLFIG
jgi:hypothetical protein